MLVVTIDEKEYLRLGLLLEQVFPGATIQMASIVINSQGSSRQRQMARVDEYAFFVLIGEGTVLQTEIEMLQSDDVQSQAGSERIWFPLIRGGKDGIRAKSYDSFFPIFIDDETGELVNVGEPLPREQNPEDVPPPPTGQSMLLPIGKRGEQGRWQMARREFLKRLEAGHVRVGRRERSGRWPITYLRAGTIRRIEKGEIQVLGRASYNNTLIVENSSDVTRTRVPKTVWYRKLHNAGTYGSALLWTSSRAGLSPFRNPCTLSRIRFGLS